MEKKTRDIIKGQFAYIGQHPCKIVKKDGKVRANTYKGVNQAVSYFDPIHDIAIIKTEGLEWKEDNIGVAATLIEEFSAKLPYGMFFKDKDGKVHKLIGLNFEIPNECQVIDEDGGSHNILVCSPILRDINKDITNTEQLALNALLAGEDTTHSEIVKWLDKHLFDQRGFLKNDMAYPWSALRTYSPSEISDMMDKLPDDVEFEAEDGVITIAVDNL